MAENTQITQDQSGINRTADGSIADPKAPVTIKTEKAETTILPPEPKAKVEPKVEAKVEDKDATLAAGDDKAPVAKTAPEKYEFKAPEGTEFDQATLDKVTPIFKELGLSQDQAQKLVDFYAEQSTQAAEAPVKFYAEMRDGWRKEVIADKALGNGVDNLRPEVKAGVAAVINSLGTLAEPFREAMNLTGVGDHPAFVKALFAFSTRLGEGKHIAGNGPSKFGQTRPGGPNGPGAAALYPNLKSGSDA